MSSSKLERLLNLTAVLLNTIRPLSAEEIREKVEGYPEGEGAFRRSFERDKEDLRELGIPLTVAKIEATDPPLDGYLIRPDDYYLADPGLEPDELAALHLASLAVRVDGLSDGQAFWKLGGVGAASQPGQPGLGEALGAGELVSAIPTDPALVPIFQAIGEGKTIGFDYNGARREIDPWRLDFHRGRWYLTGYDHLRSGERNFRLDRIEGTVERTGEAIRHSAPAEATAGPERPWEMGDEAPTTARLRVDGSRAAGVAQQLGQAVEAANEGDGSVVFTVPVVSYEPFRYFVLGMLDWAELIEPEEWRADLLDWLRATAAGDQQTQAVGR